MIRKVDQISDILANKECVETSIPKKLKNFVTTSLRDGKNRAAIGMTSALRSVTNIGVSLVSFVENLRNNMNSFVNNENAQRLGRLCCTVIPKLIDLSKTIATLSWLEPHGESLTEFCKTLKELNTIK